MQESCFFTGKILTVFTSLQWSRGLGCDINPTFFSHPRANGLTLSSSDEEIHKF